jgi:hypothetical protein
MASAITMNLLAELNSVPNSTRSPSWARVKLAEALGNVDTVVLNISFR